MSAPLSLSSWEKDHLWLYLLALGFDAGEAAAGKISTHLRLGVNLFDKPNKDAFHIVAYFLFSKLDQSHCNDIFRLCFPPTDKKADSEFRKHSCELLRRISDECGNSFPPVVASLFLSPGGPKFIHLMYHFARYVLMHHIKADSADASMHYPEAVNSRPLDFNIAVAKYRVAQNRFLQNLQKEDLIIQELQKKAQLFGKRIRDLRFENADLDKQLQKMEKKIDQNQSNTEERVEKVRCLWALIMETLTLLQKEREVVDSVVKGHVDQYVLDGTSVAINVPRSLLEKVEKEMHEFHVGNVYEEGKLNILTVIQLLNKALEMLMHSHRHIDKNALKLDLQYIEGKTKFQNDTLLGLKSLRQKLKREDRVSINQSIAEKQQEWDMKWENYLGQSPFHLIKDPNPALDLLPAMSPLSFTPATEEAYKSSVFCQYPASIPDTTKKKNFQKNIFEIPGKASGSQDGSTMVTAERIVMSSSNLAAESENRKHRSLQKRSNTEAPKRTDHSSYQILKYKGRNPRLVETVKKKTTDVFKTPPSVKREDPLKKAQEQLAEQVADVVVSHSPQSTQGKGKEMEDLIGTLISDPFLTRKQIPRTPENLITEIRSSWKKAIQAEESSSIELNHTEVTKDASVPAFRNRMDSSMACFMSSCISDTAESPFLEVQSPFSFQQAVTRHGELPTQQAAAGTLDEMFSEQGLACTVSDKCVTKTLELGLKTVNKHVTEPDCSPENGIATETLSPYVSQNSSMCTTLPWDGSQIVSGISSDSHEVIQLGILQETLPEEGGSISLNSFNDFELDEVREENSRDDKVLPDCVGENERKLDFQSIRSRYEALKQTVLENSLSSKKQIPRCRSEFSLSPVSLETNCVLTPLGKPYASDAELKKIPSHMIHLETKVLLSPLVAFSPVQQRKQSSSQDRGDLFNKLKEK
ncbi:HAUS augmin-like complex subunit 6 [Rhineura floridana]|uniref:HAUS augmin-like complex subunit 6 n=1 Tax=Rhineura floridana TaxID=261503 RepID=UPI002AC81BCA|nr:HAUS augmin-like complex subunit 6 [Rhineura floridana]